MDRITEQVVQIETTIGKLREDLDAVISAINTAGNGEVSAPHAAYWRRLVELLTGLVLDADERFHEQMKGQGGAS